MTFKVSFLVPERHSVRLAASILTGSNFASPSWISTNDSDIDQTIKAESRGEGLYLLVTLKFEYLASMWSAMGYGQDTRMCSPSMLYSPTTKDSN